MLIKLMETNYVKYLKLFMIHSNIRNILKTKRDVYNSSHTLH